MEYITEPVPSPDNLMVKDLVRYSLNQEAAIARCNAVREGLIDLIEATNRANATAAEPRRWSLF